MKKYSLKTNIVLLFLLFFSKIVLGQTWIPVGPDDNNRPRQELPVIIGPNISVSPQKVVYLSYTDANAINIKKFQDGLWTTVGISLFPGLLNPGGDNLTYLKSSIAFDSSSTYIAFQNWASTFETFGRATVGKIVDGQIQIVGQQDFSKGFAKDLTLKTNSSNSLFLAYIDLMDSSKAIVKTLKQGVWTTVGSNQISNVTVSNLCFNLVSDSIPTVSYYDNIEQKILVKQLRNEVWTEIYSSELIPKDYLNDFRFISKGQDIYIHISDYDYLLGNNLFVYKNDVWNSYEIGNIPLSGYSYYDLSIDTLNTLKLALDAEVFKLYNNEWQSLAYDSTLRTTHYPIAVNHDASGNFYYIYQNAKTVKKVSDRWETLGSIGISATSKITIDNNGIGYALYNDYTSYKDIYGQKIDRAFPVIAKTVNNKWVKVPTIGIDTSNYFDGILRFDNNNNAYLAYSQRLLGSPLTFKISKLVDGSWQSVTDYSLGELRKFEISPNGIPYLLITKSNSWRPYDSVLVYKLKDEKLLKIGNSISIPSGYIPYVEDKTSICIDDNERVAFSIITDENKLMLSIYENDQWKNFNRSFSNGGGIGLRFDKNNDLYFGSSFKPYNSPVSTIAIQKYSKGEWSDIVWYSFSGQAIRNEGLFYFDQQNKLNFVLTDELFRFYVVRKTDSGLFKFSESTPYPSISNFDNWQLDKLGNLYVYLQGYDSCWYIKKLKDSCYLPSVLSQTTSQSLCAGKSIKLDVIPIGTGPFNYKWNTSDTAKSLLTSVPGVYISTISGKCGSITTSPITITIDTKPTAILSQPENQTICSGFNSSFTISATGTGILSYLWSTGSQKDTLKTSDEGAYNVTVTGSCGTVVSNQASLKVLSIPTIRVTPSEAYYCEGSITYITHTILGSIPIYSYRWNNNATTPGIYTSVPGTYQLTIIGQCGTLTSYNSANVYKGQYTTILGQSVSQSICEGGNASLSFSGTGSPPLSFQWSNGSLQNPLITSISGTYLVTVSGGCNNVVSQPIIVTTIPSTRIISQPMSTTICSGIFQSYTISATGTNLSYVWSNGLSNSNAMSTSVAGNNYKVTVTGTCGGISSAPFSLVVSPQTSIVTQPVANAKVCSGNPQQFIVSALGSNLSYSWSSGLSNTNMMTTSVEGTNYVVTVTGNCGIAISNTVSLSTFSSPSIVTQPISQTSCVGTNVSLLVSAIGSNLSYLWSSGATTPQITANTAGNYTATVSGLCGVPLVSNTANINTIPLTSVVNLSNTQKVCFGSNTIFVVSAIGDNLNYKWSNAQSVTPFIITSIPGNYFVTVSGTCGTVISSSFDLVNTICGSNSTTTSPPIIFVTTIPSTFTGTAGNIVWPSVTGAVTYCIKYSPTEDFSSKVVSVCGLNAPNFLFVLSAAGLKLEASEMAYYYQVAWVDSTGRLSEWSKTLSLVLNSGQVTGIQGVYEANDASYTIYPNPSSNGEFDIKNAQSGLLLQILNSQGEIVFSQKLAAESEHINPNLSRGFYLVKIGNRIKKLIVN